MRKMEETITASFCMPQTLFQKVRSVAKDEDLNLSILFRKMVRDWLGKYESDGNRIGGNNMGQ